MTFDEQHIAILVGPTCPTCESDDLRWGAPLGAVSHRRCRDCGTEYRWYSTRDSDPLCDNCGLPNTWDDDSPFCEACRLSDCVYCGVPTHAYLLSDDLACPECARGEAA